VTFTGTAYPDEFTDEFQEGDHLYDPDTGAQLGSPLRCDNRGIHVTDLDRSVCRWNQVVEEIVGDAPIDWTELDSAEVSETETFVADNLSFGD